MSSKNVVARRRLTHPIALAKPGALGCLVLWTIMTPLLSAQSKQDCSPTWTPELPNCLDQNWTNETRDRHWFIDQGSLMMPYEWFKALEKEGGQPFADGLDRYGFITDFIGKKLPGASDAPVHRELPIGFTVGKHWKLGVDFVGLTCAACHSGLILYKDKRYIIEGAPAMVDFDRFLTELVAAMDATALDFGRWQRFAARIPGTEPKLKDDFTKRKDKLAERAATDKPSDSAGPAGFGRLDAFGHIFNRVVVEHLGNPKEVVAKSPSDAPASFPALWDIAQHSHVQWNYSAPNLGVGESAPGSLIRNIGEVLGVFGEVEIVPGSSLFGYQWTPWRYSGSVSGRMGNLRTIEGDLAKLRSPQWPFGGLKTPAVDAGRKVFATNCSSCHVEINRLHSLPGIPIVPVRISEVQTDPEHDRAIRERTAPAGKLAGAPAGALLFKLPLGLESLSPQPTSIETNNVKIALLTAHLALNLVPTLEERFKAFLLGIQDDKVTPKDVYKARPLNGVWATAPYLHNGSIPNLRELLTAPGKRQKRFCVGDRKFDAGDVGYQAYFKDARDGACPQGTSLVKTGPKDEAPKGSSNMGHPYGSELTPAERDNLIEFLKSL